MAEIPDKLLHDIREFLNETQGATEDFTKDHDRFVYAIDLTARWDDKPTKE